eukprot:TRINITY_DN326_c0_g1_i1.p1 TRINITY_DN326_c0_g1~~TRINITY_DN326_c0_g1_i1.p1  ORF type:complete len:1048 (+),score=423.32 TRINITY_DN326_c0_g1_i1:47-3190(+)
MSGVTYKISGRGEKGGAVKAMIIFTAAFQVDGKDPTNPQKEDLVVYVEGPDNIKPTIMGGPKAQYHVGFTPHTAGQYYFDFVFRGQWADKPFMLPVTGPTGKAPEFEYTGKLRLENDSVAKEAEEKRRREEEERQREEERKRKEEEDRIRREEEERKRKEEEERKLKEEEERKRKEEEERKRKEAEEAEEAERKRKEEEERKRKEEEDRKRKEEEERKRKEEEDRKRKEEEDRKRKEEEDRKRKEAEEADRKRKEEDRKRKEEEDRKRSESEKKRKEEEELKAKEEATRKAKEEAALKAKDDEAKRASQKAKEDLRKQEDEKEKQRQVQRQNISYPSSSEDTSSSSSDGSLQLGDSHPSTDAYGGYIFTLFFTFRALNKHGKPIKAGTKVDFDVYSNGDKVSNVEDLGDGSYCFDYNTVPGDNSIDVKLNGKSIQGFPFSFRRKTRPEVEEWSTEIGLEERKLEEARIQRELEEKLKREEEERKRKEEEESKRVLESAKSPKTATSVKKEPVKSTPTKVETDKPSTPISTVPSVRAQMWEQKLKGGVEDTQSPKTKVELPAGTGATKLSSVWEKRLRGEEVEEDKSDKTEKSPVQSSESSRGNFAQRWLKNASEKDEETTPKKVELPEGTGATKIAAVWQKKEAGEDEESEKKPEKTVELPEGTGATKLASVWQNRLEGKEEPKEEKKTAIELPLGTGASKVAAVWENKLKEEPKPEIERGQGPSNAPSKLASDWENKVAANSKQDTPSKTKEDIEELKKMMEKEREQFLSGSSGAQAEPEATTSSSSSGSSSSEDEVTINDDEDLSILLHIVNEKLEGCADSLGHPLPLAASDDLYKLLSDGVTACYFLDQMVPGALDVSLVSKDADDAAKKDNWTLCIDSAVASGCKSGLFKVEELAEGDVKPIQNLLWQIIKLGLETDVKMAEEYLGKVIECEDKDEILIWPIDELLLKWVNALIKKRGLDRTANSLTEDFKDSYFHLQLLDEILATGTEMIEEDDLELRALSVVDFASNIEKGPLATAQGILDGVYWQNYILICNLLLTASIL